MARTSVHGAETLVGVSKAGDTRTSLRPAMWPGFLQGGRLAVSRNVNFDGEMRGGSPSCKRQCLEHHLGLTGRANKCRKLNVANATRVGLCGWVYVDVELGTDAAAKGVPEIHRLDGEFRWQAQA